MKRKICVITSSRADYGLLKRVMRGIQEDSGLTLQAIATGMHLSPLHGLTIGEIEADGFLVDRKVECLSESDQPIAIADAGGRALSGCARALDELRPDLVLVLGDRFEIFAACAAALFQRIPIAHIHGGEVTVGAYDEVLRHSITKMSSIHFVAAEKYGKRVIQLGEHPDNVYLVGGLGVDAVNESTFLSRVEVEQALDLKLTKRNLLVTFHPATLEKSSPREQVLELLAALSDLQDTTLILTMPNADTGGAEIREQFKEFADRNVNAHVFDSLGQDLYFSCMRLVDGVIGNSSSGILEAPSFRVGTINIGTRQLGRIQSESIINCEANSLQIKRAIEKLYTDEFKSILERCSNPYGSGGASHKIIQILREIEFETRAKDFYDLP